MTLGSHWRGACQVVPYRRVHDTSDHKVWCKIVRIIHKAVGQDHFVECSTVKMTYLIFHYFLIIMGPKILGPTGLKWLISATPLYIFVNAKEGLTFP